MIFISLKSYKNFCVFGFYNAKTNKETFFEISEYYNDLKPILVFLKENQKDYLVGYNMENFNNFVLNFIFNNFESLLTERGAMVAFQIHSIALTLDPANKYSNYFKFIDLMKYVSNSNERISMNDLKYLYDCNDMTDFPEGDNGFIDQIEKKNVFNCIRNNIDIMRKIYDNVIHKLKLRLEISELCGINVLNKYDESIGNNYLLGKYMKIYNVPKSSFLQLKNQEEFNPDEFIVKEEFNYKNESIKNFYKLTKQTTLNDEIKLPPIDIGDNKKFLLVGKQLKLEIKDTFIENDLINIDLKYIYIEYLIRNKIYPSFLDEHFYLMIKEVYDDLLKAERENNIQEIEKCDLILNKLIDNMSVPSSFTESKITQHKIYLNVILIILKLIDDLISLGADIILCNKNYITIKSDKNKKEIAEVINKWHDQFYFRKKISIYKKMIFGDYNNYKIFLKTKNGEEYIINEGYFIEKRSIYSKHPLIIIKAFNAFVENNVDIRSFVEKNNNIDDYILYYKTNRSFDLTYNKSIIQRNIRFVYSPKGYNVGRINKEKQKEELLEQNIKLLITKDNVDIDKSKYVLMALSFKNQFIKIIQNKIIW